jgi:hypothetical protein
MLPKPGIRRYLSKSGEIRTRVYTTIKGLEHANYRRQQSQKYYHAKRLAVGGQLYGIAERLDHMTLEKMRSLHLAGMSIRAIAKQFGLSRFTATKALTIANDKCSSPVL